MYSKFCSSGLRGRTSKQKQPTNVRAATEQSGKSKSQKLITTVDYNSGNKLIVAYLLIHRHCHLLGDLRGNDLEQNKTGDK